MKAVVLAFSITLITIFGSSCNSKTKPNPQGFPEQSGFVNDHSNILTDAEEKELVQIIKAHEKATGNEIAILIVDTIPSDDIFNYTLDLANYWEVGKKDQNNGVLIAVIMKLHTIQIQNGYGIEEKLSDEETKRIIDQEMIPEFRSQNDFQGIRNGVVAIIEKLE